MIITTKLTIGQRTITVVLNSTDIFYAVSAGALLAGALLIWSWPALNHLVC